MKGGGGSSSKRGEKRSRMRIRSENWSAEETVQMLELRKATVVSALAKGADAWKHIAEQLAARNPESPARTAKQVSQRWDTLVKQYVSVEEQCNSGTGRTYGEVIGERQKRGKTEAYRQLWHELIAQGNPGKRRAAQLEPTVASVGQTFAKSLLEILDAIDRSMLATSAGGEMEGHVTGSNWEPEDETKASGKKLHPDVETMADSFGAFARATALMFATMQSISKAASTSGPFCVKVDQEDWSAVMQKLSAISQRYLEISRRGVREEVGADDYVFQQTSDPAMRSYDHNNSTQRTLPLTPSLCTKIRTRTEKSSSSGKRNISTGSSIFAGLPDIVPWSPKTVLAGGSNELWEYDSDHDSIRSERPLEAGETQ